RVNGASNTERERGLEDRLPRDRRCGYRAHVVCLRSVEELRFRQRTHEPARFEVSNARFEWSRGAHLQPGNSGSVIAHDYGVPNAGTPPHVLGRRPELDRAGIVPHSRLSRNQVADGRAAEAPRQISRIRARVPAIREPTAVTRRRSEREVVVISILARDLVEASVGSCPEFGRYHDAKSPS